jgi:pyruvate/2-oxoglutarate dehydrogenase complex dihydrolipoamide dehydrogenase (E3) component
MEERVDVVVVGMGPGGEEVGNKLAEAGLNVVGIEQRLLGGECPYWGCVPSKMMIRAGNLLAEAWRIPGMAGDASVTPSWVPVAGRIRDDATDNWDDKVAVERFEGKGGHFIRGTGHIEAANRVSVDGRTIAATRALVIGTGTEPAIPHIPGLSSAAYWTNHDAIETEEIPASMIVLGGGAVGVELAQVFARFGAQVSIVEGADRLIPLEEPESGQLLGDIFQREGITVRAGVMATAVGNNAGSITVQLSDGSSLSAERLLVAVGRRADLKALGVANAGLDATARAIKVDAHSRAAPGIWAVGDVTGIAAFTHTAMYQARIAVSDILGHDSREAVYRGMPRVTFTDPEIGATGLTEAQARQQGLSVRTGMMKVSTSARGWIHKAGNDGFIKLIADADRNVLVGATSAGPVGGEVLSMLTLAVHAEIPLSVLDSMIYAYPTFHRGVTDALRALLEQESPLR